MTSLRNMKVAPYNSCLVCFKGDTTTGIVFQGEAEWAVAGLMKLGVPDKEALSTIEFFAEHDLGCDPGCVPAFRFDYTVRVCSACASKAGFPVGSIASGQLPGVVQELS